MIHGRMPGCVGRAGIAEFGKHNLKNFLSENSFSEEVNPWGLLIFAISVLFMPTC